MKTIFTLLIAAAIFAGFSLPAKAQGIPPVPGVDVGSFSMGLGFYKAPGDAISDSGLYALARYEIATFLFEIDYGIGDQNFFLGCADYLYRVPTAEGITKTSIALGAGLTFVNNDPTLDDSKVGGNILVNAGFADTYSVQLRYDLLGDDANLFTLGVSYQLN